MSSSQNLKDHRQIGQELELFFTDDLAPGAAFWLPKGMVIFKELEKYIRELTLKAGYQETSTPIMVKSQLFKDSGHWTKFGEHKMYNLSILEPEEEKYLMRSIMDDEDKIKNDLQNNHNQPIKRSFPVSSKEEIDVIISLVLGSLSILPMANYTLKPMNCPESTIIYRFKPRSYRELPLRISEIGRLFRREQAGEVGGLLRVRQFVMDDAHIYAREDQVKGEISAILDTMITFYKSLGFDYDFRVATRPEENFAGTKDDWKKTEQALEEVLVDKKIKYTYKKGEGAFYGPKIDLHIQAINKDWQLSTVQIDLHQPKAFGLKYVDENGKLQQPAMIHRAIFGSFERFIAILTEHFQGAFPLWLSPAQVVVLPITDRHQETAKKIHDELQKAGIRSEVDTRQETLQAKIRDATLQKVPYMAIIGDKEVTNKNISVRTREGKDLGSLSLSQFLQRVKEEIDKKV